MSDTLAWFSSVARDSGALLLLDTAVKATVLLGMACLVAVLLRRASAAVRHRVWCLTCCGLLLLPVLSCILPGWRVPMLPELSESGPSPRVDTAMDSPPVAPQARATDRYVGPARRPAMPLEQGPWHEPAGGFFVEESLIAPSMDSQWQEEPFAQPAPAMIAAPSDGPPSTLTWQTLVGVVWLLVMGVTILPVIVSLVYSHILGNTARPVVDTESTRLLRELCQSLGVRRRVRLLETGRSLVPMTWGSLRPILLFPSAWRDWSLERRRIAILHELAHVKRNDVAFQLLVRLACALYWFHPLVWYALRRVRIERELACDDCVLMAGERPSDYAQQLVEIARSCRILAMPAAVAMAHTTRLERRIRAMLDRARSHLPLSRHAARVFLVCAALVVTALAVVRPEAKSAAQEEVTAAEASPSEQSADESVPRKDGDDDTIPGSDRALGPDEPADLGKIDITGDPEIRPEPKRSTRSRDRQGSEVTDSMTEAGFASVVTGTSAAGAKQTAGGSSDEDDIRLEYRGQVVDPDGNPVAGAKIALVYWFHGVPPNYEAKLETVTDGGGRFEFTTTRSYFEPNARDSWYAYSIAATADGYGFVKGLSVQFETTGQALKLMPAESLDNLKEHLAKSDRVLRLVRDDTPITGRVVNMDGQPIQGARIRVDNVWYNKEGDLTSWEQAAREDKADFYSLRRHTLEVINGPQLPLVIPDAISDGEGRFKLKGAGRERIVQLLISGPGIETKQIKARTRKGAKIVVPHEWDRDGRPRNREIYFGADFVYVPGPSKPIVGRITDADTSEPISGVVVSAGQMGTFFAFGQYYLKTVTDAEGRYRLEGLPIGDDNRVLTLPEADTAYLPAGRDVNTTIDEPTVTQDFQLKHGVWVHGRAVDDRTGRGLSGRVQYYAFRDNPHLKSYQRFKGAGISHERRADEDGHFEIAVLPGMGILTFSPDDHTRYHRGLGTETITGPTLDMGGSGKTFDTVPSICHSPNEHSLRQINLEEGSDPIELTLTLTSGVDVKGHLRDPNGDRLAGGVVSGSVFHGSWCPIRGDEFLIEGYYPDRPRDLFFHHPERELAGYYRLEGQPPKQLTVTLQPAGSLRGRLVDSSDAPIPNVVLGGDGVPSENYGDASLRLATDQDGRFHIRGLIPGRKYTVVGRGNRISGNVLTDATVEAGQTNDVGQVTFRTPERPPRKPNPTAKPKEQANGTNSAPDATAQTITARGVVLSPERQPMSGVTVRAATPVWAMLKPIVGEDAKPPTREVKTNKHGKFAITFSTQPFGDLSRFDSRWQDIWKKTQIAASAPGYGPAWVAYEDIQPDEPITLRLVPDLPVKGRVIDLEARPVAGLTVKVSGPSAAEDEDLTPWLEAIKAGELPWTVWKLAPKSVDPEVVDIPEQVVTDDQGRFEIHGVGRERHFSLVFEGETVAHRSVDVATRQIGPIDRVISMSPLEGTEPVYGATFTFTAAPSRPVVGTVRDAATGQPLEGVSVESYKLAGYPYANHRVLETTTDHEGRFRLIGMPKADGNSLLALPNDDQPYFMREVDVPDPPGLGPATVEIELHRGLWITGRVTDKATGQPVQARLHYLPLRSNEFAQAIPEFDEHGNADGDQMRYHTRPDGSYRLVGLPGRAIVGAESVLRQYRRGVGADQLNVPKYRDTDWFDTYRNPINPGPTWPNVLKEINPPADAEAVNVDFQMDPGQSVRIAIVGPDGRPVTGVTIDGLRSGGGSETIQESTIEAINFSPGETRTIVFYHKERNLGRVARIRPGDAATAAITVRLEPCAMVTGRLLHEDGASYVGLNVKAAVRPSENFGKKLPSVTTDSDGRFRYTIVPGSKYWLHAEGKGIRHYGTIEEELVVEPGETKDLGDLALNESREFTPRN